MINVKDAVHIDRWDNDECRETEVSPLDNIYTLRGIILCKTKK